MTDGQTDRILLAIPRLHYMQRGKNTLIIIIIPIITIITIIGLIKNNL